MNVQPTDCLQNPQIDAYLDLVKSYLQADRIAFACFLANLSFLVKELHSYRPNAPSTSNYHSIIVDLASKLKKRPKLLYGLNVLLPEDQRLDCSLSLAEVRYFVISDPRSSTIYSTSSPKVPYPSSCRDLREVVCSPSAWSQLLNSNPDKEWLVCISHLLQEILDDPSTEPALYTKAYRCLRELASRCILPPSIFLNNLRCTTGHVVQGGAFADIYQGDIDGKLVCLRVLRMFGSDRETLFKDFCSEVLVWHQLRHPNILPFIGADLDLFPGRFCFVSPWMNNGDIMSYLKKHPDHDRFKAVCEIAEGIDYLHSLKPPVTHRDIKGVSANVLVGDDLICCLADFGLSSIVESQRLGKGSPAFEGSVCWAAPEIIQPSCSVPKNAPAGDIFALGCTIYEIYTGKPPFSQYNNAMAVMMAVVEGKRPKVPPPGSWTNDEIQLWSLVELCWKAAPGERPEMYLIKHSLQDTERYEVTRRKPTSEPLRRVNRGVSVEAVSNWLRRERMQEVDTFWKSCRL
ncbi:kinase-like protein [Agrocybe pediades]|nr:kinase-like protein [Agrocybe pediades]